MARVSVPADQNAPAMPTSWIRRTTIRGTFGGRNHTPATTRATFSKPQVIPTPVHRSGNLPAEADNSPHCIASRTQPVQTAATASDTGCIEIMIALVPKNSDSGSPTQR